MNLALSVRTELRRAGIDSKAGVRPGRDHEHVRVIAHPSPTEERDLDYAADVLTLSDYTVTPGFEPWYINVTKEN